MFTERVRYGASYRAFSMTVDGEFGWGHEVGVRWHGFWLYEWHGFGRPVIELIVPSWFVALLAWTVVTYSVIRGNDRVKRRRRTARGRCAE